MLCSKLISMEIHWCSAIPPFQKQNCSNARWSQDFTWITWYIILKMKITIGVSGWNWRRIKDISHWQARGRRALKLGGPQPGLESRLDDQKKHQRDVEPDIRPLYQILRNPTKQTPIRPNSDHGGHHETRKTHQIRHPRLAQPPPVFDHSLRLKAKAAPIRSAPNCTVVAAQSTVGELDLLSASTDSPPNADDGWTELRGGGSVVGKLREGRSIASEFGGVGSIAGGLGGGTRRGSGGEGVAPSVGGRGGRAADERRENQEERAEKGRRRIHREQLSRRRNGESDGERFFYMSLPVSKRVRWEDKNRVSCIEINWEWKNREVRDCSAAAFLSLPCHSASIVFISVFFLYV